ncbi:hypothetical protein ADL05_22805 [Nocardiopsis sp. NRRL B-16309]|nr:hypothetical protein ADL05_22805 [Nocardiopsis sp. NRRL B-16309]
MNHSRDCWRTTNLIGDLGKLAPYKGAVWRFDQIRRWEELLFGSFQGDQHVCSLDRRVFSGHRGCSAGNHFSQKKRLFTRSAGQEVSYLEIEQSAEFEE